MAVNRAGTDSGIAFAGHSAIYGPNGDILASAPDTAEQLLIADIHLEDIATFRGIIRAYPDRRPDIYGVEPRSVTVV